MIQNPSSEEHIRIPIFSKLKDLRFPHTGSIVHLLSSTLPCVADAQAVDAILKGLRSRLQEQQDENAHFRQRVAELSRQLQRAKNTCIKAHDVCNELQSLNTELTQERDNLQDKLQRTQQRLEAGNARLAQEEAERREVAQKLEDERRRTKQLQAALQQMTEFRDMMQQDLDGARHHARDESDQKKTAKVISLFARGVASTKLSEVEELQQQLESAQGMICHHEELKKQEQERSEAIAKQERENIPMVKQANSYYLNHKNGFQAIFGDLENFYGGLDEASGRPQLSGDSDSHDFEVALEQQMYQEFHGCDDEVQYSCMECSHARIRGAGHTAGVCVCMCESDCSRRVGRLQHCNDQLWPASIKLEDRMG